MVASFSTVYGSNKPNTNLQTQHVHVYSLWCHHYFDILQKQIKFIAKSNNTSIKLRLFMEKWINHEKIMENIRSKANDLKKGKKELVL